jgi:hypothetical protein
MPDAPRVANLDIKVRSNYVLGEVLTKRRQYTCGCASA